MIGALERHHARAPAREQRRLERRLDRVRAGGAEHAARGNAARVAAHERFEQLDLHGGRMHVAEPVQQPLGLRAHRRDDARMRVPHVRDAEAGREIDVAIAVDVPDVGALRALPEDGRGREGT